MTLSKCDPQFSIELSNTGNAVVNATLTNSRNGGIIFLKDGTKLGGSISVKKIDAFSGAKCGIQTESPK